MNAHDVFNYCLGLYTGGVLVSFADGDNEFGLKARIVEALMWPWMIGGYMIAEDEDDNKEVKKK